MTTPQTLPVTDFVSVSVTLTPAGAQSQNISTLLVLGNSNVIDTVQRIRPYTTLAGVAADFGTTAPEYLAAALWFGQSPQPTTLYIGRWAQTATAGELVGATLSAANSLYTAWTGITAGSLALAVNGGAVTNVTGINLSTATTMAGVAALIQTAIAAVDAGVTVVWNAVYSRFQITSSTTGASSSVSFLTAAGTGTDISAQMGMQSTSSGAYQVPGQAAETALAAATLFDANFGQSWYALMMPTITADTDHVAVAGYINAATNKHLYGVTTQEAGVLVSTNTTNVAYLLQQLGYSRSIVQYSSTSLYAVASLFAEALTVNYNGNNTAITLAYKQEPGVTAENLNQTQYAALTGFNANAFLAVNNATNILQPGVVSNGTYIDIMTGTDWLALAIQTAVYNLLYTTTTKVPQTDAGTNLILTTIESILSQAVTNGLLAPGTWYAGGFGQIVYGQYLPKGFYVYAPPISSQSEATRATRASVPIQIAAKLAGAIQSVSVAISVNQ
jgi:hypothetical protein